MNQNKQAFTLIELLVVVLIIGILAAVAVPQYQKAVLKSRYATLKNLVESLAQAEEVHYIAIGNYTTDWETLDISIPSSPIKDVDCGIAGNNGYWNVFCTIKKDGLDFLAYQIHLMHSVLGSRRQCNSYQDTDLSAIQSRICAEETKRTTPSSVISTSDGIKHIYWVYLS